MTAMFVAAAFLAALRPSWSVDPQAEEVPIEQLPPAVVNAVLANFPGAQIHEAAREVDDGTLLYGVAIQVGNDRKQVKLTAAGSLVRVGQ